MTVLPIYVVPQAVLKQVAAPVAEITADIRKLAEDMLDTMYAAQGIGLAAPQIGVLKRVVVMDVEQTDEEEGKTTRARGKPRIFINPEILEASEDLNVYQEGCLSIPGQYADVERPASVRIRFMDENGAVHEEEANGLYATCMQHEIDHLNGVLFTDHISKLKRDMLLKKVKKWSREIDDATKAGYVL